MKKVALLKAGVTTGLTISLLATTVPNGVVFAASMESDAKVKDTPQTEFNQTALWNIEDETNTGHDAINKGDIPQENEDITIENTEDGLVVTKYEKVEDSNLGRFKSAAVSRWGCWGYTNIAVSTGVAALGTFAGIPTWALQGLLNGASWKKKDAKPGEAVAKLWDKNKNGWIAFYYQRGYNAAGKVVATRYSTR